MKRVNDTYREADKFGAGLDGYTEGEPGVTPRTGIRAEMLDHIQEEIAQTIEAAGFAIPTTGTSYVQLAQVIQATAMDAAVSNMEEKTLAGTIANAANAAACLFDDDGNETWILCHAGGEISRSVDGGETWTEDASATAEDLRAVCSNGSNATEGTLFVAVGNTGDIVTSAGAGAWTARTPAGGFAGTFWHVFWGGSLFVALGSGGTIQTSPDGITWTARTAAGGYANDFRGGAWNGSLYVIVGDAGEIQTSPDGITWTHRTPAGGYAGDYAECAYGNGVFVIAGSANGIQTSPDGITWTARTPHPDFSTWTALGFSSGIFVLLSATEGLLAVSTQGSSWRARRHAGNGTMNGVGDGPGRVVIPTSFPGVFRSAKASMLLGGY